MNELMNDINDQNIINKNPMLFIKHRNINKYNQSINNIDDLPINSDIGSLFLIKGKTIIELYSWYDCNYSMYMQINYTTNRWIGSINIINLDVNDSITDNLNLDKYKILYEKDLYKLIIIKFIQMGFYIYIK